MYFLLTNSGHLPSTAAFSALIEQYLLEMSFGFSGRAHNRGLPSNPTIYITSPPLDEDLPLAELVAVHLLTP